LMILIYISFIKSNSKNNNKQKQRTEKENTE